MTIKIDKGVPLPPLNRVATPYPIEEMEVGDSFFAPNQGVMNWGGRLNRHRKAGKAFSVRTVVENGVKGTRVWRIA